MSQKSKEPRMTGTVLPSQRGFLLVEHRGFEPLTFSLRTRRATNCANAPTTRLRYHIRATRATGATQSTRTSSAPDSSCSLATSSRAVRMSLTIVSMFDGPFCGPPATRPSTPSNHAVGYP